MKWRPPPRLAAALPLLLAVLGAAQGEETVDLAINTARVWLTQAQEVAAAVNDATSSAGVPPVEANFTITRAHSVQVRAAVHAAQAARHTACQLHRLLASAVRRGCPLPRARAMQPWPRPRPRPAKQPSGYMVAASNGQVADIAFSIYGWNNSALEQGYAM